METGRHIRKLIFYYDDPAHIVQSNISTQHVSAPASVSGNLTSILHWTGGSSTFNTYQYVYDTGMVQQVIDGNGHQAATYSYSPIMAGAFPTTVCNALTQCTNYGYDYNTGQVTSIKDANNQAILYTYDIMLRPTQINYPDGGETSIFYRSPILIEEEKEINTSAWTDSWSQFDGLAAV